MIPALHKWYIKYQEAIKMAALNKKTVDDINVKGKRVLCRCDFNVPLDGSRITDETRLVAALPTIKKLIADGETDADVVVLKMKEIIEKEPLAKIDYVKAVNGLTMQQQKEIKAPMLIAMAVYIGKTRLIDNYILG